MYPDLFYLGNFVFKTHYLLNLMGIAAGFLVLLYTTGRLDPENRRRVFIFAAVIFIPFMLGGRAGSDLERILAGKPVCSSFLYIIGTVSLWWGLAAATVFAFPLSAVIKNNVWDTADYFAVSIAAGAVFVRAGCFMHGCCHGKTASGSLLAGYSFAPNSPAYSVFGDAPVIPTQIYEALCWLLIFLVLFLRINRKAFNGEIIILMSMLYSFFRFLLEFLRYHDTQQSYLIGKIWPVSVFFISVILYILINYYFKNKFPKIFKVIKAKT